MALTHRHYSVGGWASDLLAWDSQLTDDMLAIDAFFARTECKTARACTLKREWAEWFHGLKLYTSSDLDQARARRNEFNIANAVTREERAAVDRVLNTGMTREEARGEPRGTLPEVEREVFLGAAGRYLMWGGLVVGVGGIGYLIVRGSPAARAARRVRG